MKRRTVVSWFTILAVAVGVCGSAYAGDWSSLTDEVMQAAQGEVDAAMDAAQAEVDAAMDAAQNEVNAALDGASGVAGNDASAAEGDTAESEAESNEPTTASIKDYVGRNVASFGYTSLGGDRLDDGYGQTLDTLKLSLVADDGTYIDIEDEDQLKQYVVTAQSIEPDSEITFTYDEYGLGEHQTYDEIELLVKRVDSDTENPILTELTQTMPSPDLTTQYVKDYVGRNLASVGYEGLDSEWHDSYNGTWNTVDVVIITEDGSYISAEDKETQKQYVVTSQNPAPNSELIFTYDEYGFVSTQTYSEVELHVSKVG